MEKIYHYSSKDKSLQEQFFREKLKDAYSYDRIAGYFSSAILGLAEKEFLGIEGKIRIICNSEITIEDVETARRLEGKAGNNAVIETIKRQMKDEWDEHRDELKKHINKYTNIDNNHFFELYEKLKPQDNSEPKIQIKVIPKDFKFLHGKAGLITYKDSFLVFAGSMNETPSGWAHNYEILWSDNSEESKKWFDEEFDFFWNSLYAINLSDYVIEDIKRIYSEKVIPLPKIEELEKVVFDNPALILKASPIYNEGTARGLWEHQEAFVELMIKEHFYHPDYGARFILSDMVGLGKTIEMGAFAKLLATFRCKPILFIVPKNITKQWQDELMRHFYLPSAIWENQGNKYGWCDEDENFVHSKFKDCPRKIGIVSQSLITSGSSYADDMLNLEYECVFVDEAHRARRNIQNPKTVYNNKNPENASNNLYKFLYNLSPKAKGMILATATPIQLYPTDLWDLLHILSHKNDSVLGNANSLWNTNLEKAIGLVSGQHVLFLPDLKPENKQKLLTNPFVEPLIINDTELGGFIKRLKLFINDKSTGEDDQAKVMLLREDNVFKFRIDEEYFKNNNPFTFRVVRRTREQLEKDGLIKPIYVEAQDFKIPSNENLKQIFKLCDAYSQTLKNANGFFKTLLLRRVCSSIKAGLNTVEKILNNDIGNIEIIGDDDADDIDDEILLQENEKRIPLTSEQKSILKALKDKLIIELRTDSKCKKILHTIKTYELYSDGVIVFSQFYDTAMYVFENLIRQYADLQIGLYAGGNKSKIYNGKKVIPISKHDLKKLVEHKKVKILIGTDAASEGLNLQTMIAEINVDLPWNPIRLEQRKGRVYRIGQLSDTIYIFNLLYEDSIDNRVLELLGERFENIFNVFSEVPDTIKQLQDDIFNKKLNKDKALAKIETAYNEKKRFEIAETPLIDKKLKWAESEESYNKEELFKIYCDKWDT